MASYRVVTYARVSTKGQQDRGASLVDQETRFTRWLQDGGHTRVGKYKEAVSGRTADKRKTFQQMISELPTVKAQYVVVDSLDRWTRDAASGYAMLERLRKLKAKLWELEFAENRPLDLATDDWRYVHDKFGDAQAESRRIQKRQIKRYAEQRERGATTTNRAPFGTRLEGDKGHKRLFPDPKTAPIVQEIDRRALAGESHRKILLWLSTVAPTAFKSRRRLSEMLLDIPRSARSDISIPIENKPVGNYVRSELRSPEDQRKLRLASKGKAARYGSDRSTSRKGTYFASGLLACGECVDGAKIPADHALMYMRYITANDGPSFVCDGVRRGRHIHKARYFSFTRVFLKWMEHLERLKDEFLARQILDAWVDEPVATANVKLRPALERRLADCDKEERAIDARCDSAVRLMTSKKRGVTKEAEAALERANADRLNLQATRDGLKQELAQQPIAEDRKTEAEQLMGIRSAVVNWDKYIYGGLRFNPHHKRWYREKPDDAAVRAWLKRWVDALGPPIVERRIPRGSHGWRRENNLVVRWLEYPTKKAWNARAKFAAANNALKSRKKAAA